MSYDPRPIDTAKVKLDKDVLELTELLAKHAHDIWAQQRITDGWTFGAQRDDGKKHHPCLIPYEDLPDSEKKYDRNAALQTLQAIIALGYRIQKAGASP